MQRAKRLSIAYKPASDQASWYFALQTGRIRLHRIRIRVSNRLDRSLGPGRPRTPLRYHGHLRHGLPRCAPKITAFERGQSGRPRLRAGARQPALFPLSISSSFAASACPGTGTTAGCLLKWACPDAIIFEMPVDKISAAVASGQLDAGVLSDERSAVCRAIRLAQGCRPGKAVERAYQPAAADRTERDQPRL